MLFEIFNLIKVEYGIDRGWIHGWMDKISIEIGNHIFNFFKKTGCAST